jgi:hypothetical protein
MPSSICGSMFLHNDAYQPCLSWVSVYQGNQVLSAEAHSTPRRKKQAQRPQAMCGARWGWGFAHVFGVFLTTEMISSPAAFQAGGQWVVCYLCPLWLSGSFTPQRVSVAMTLLLSLLQGIHGAPTKLFTPSRILLREKHGKEVTQHRERASLAFTWRRITSQLKPQSCGDSCCFFRFLKWVTPQKHAKLRIFDREMGPSNFGKCLFRTTISANKWIK